MDLAKKKICCIFVAGNKSCVADVYGLCEVPARIASRLIT